MKNYTLIENATRENYLAVEAELIADFSAHFKDATVEYYKCGQGTITDISGETFDELLATVCFTGETKKFALKQALSGSRFFKLLNENLLNIYNDFSEVHTNLAAQWNAIETILKDEAREAKKQAEANAQAEAKYQKLRDKAIRDFEQLSNRDKDEVTEAEEFYYSLGWLTEHIGTISATLPDYLSDAFKRCFGDETPHKVIDSKKKTTSGNTMQWTWSFRATLRKPDNIPSFLASYLNPNGNALANTAFIWDLVEDYGFQFGKVQDKDKILECIPEEYIDIYEEGLIA